MIGRLNATLEAMESACQAIEQLFPGSGGKARAMLFTPRSEMADFELAVASLDEGDGPWVRHLLAMFGHLVLGDWRRARLVRLADPIGATRGDL